MGSRRKMQRNAAKKATPFSSDAAPTITLSNPVANQFAAFVLDNAQSLEARMHDALIAANPDAALALEPYYGVTGLLEAIKTHQPTPPHIDAIHAFREAYAAHCTPQVVQEDSAKGKTLAICGAGPSLAEHLDVLATVDHVWACNSALPYLISKNIRPTHGFTVDQTPAMLNEWESAPDVEYLVATTLHPHVTAHLRQHGRTLRWFHNYVGIVGPTQHWMGTDGQQYSAEYEDWLYLLLYPPTFRAGSGLNTVTRALDVASYLGYDHITVLGADCALRVSAPKPDAPIGSKPYMDWLRTSTQMHADGGNALASGATAVTMEGEIDGRVWVSKPDLLISAVWMEKMRRNQPDRITYVGDTLPVALRDKSETFLMRMPNLVDSTGRAIMVPSVGAA